MTELFIDDTMKTVGDTTINASAGRTSVTTGDRTVITGLLDELTTMGMTTNGRAPVDEVASTSAVEYRSPRVNAASRGDITIGKELDADDDAARLRLVTHHASTRTVRVYDEAADALNLHTLRDSTGTVYIAGTAAPSPGATPAATRALYDGTGVRSADNGGASLRSEGMFYHAPRRPYC